VPKRLKSPHIWQPDDPVEANARLELPAMAREYFAAGRKIAAAQPNPAELHPFRLATKRFRYTLELFRDVYGPSMDEKLELLKPVQNALGDVNDCVATAEAFREGKTFRQYLARRAEKKASEFYKAWQTEFDIPGKEEAWVLYLGSLPPVAGADEPQSVPVETSA
jgi:CHAD domain-containing protein